MRDRLFYQPTQMVYSSPETYGLTYESVRFAVHGGEQLHAWFFPARGDATGTVVHCHGNAGNITGHFEHVRWLPARGWNVLCFDYRGFGQSQGQVTRPGTIEDTHAAIDYVKSRDDVDADRIVLIGSSLGGAVGTVVAAERSDVRGLVLDSAFSHYRREVKWVCQQQWLTWGVAGIVARLLFSDGLNPIDCIGRIAPRPVLIIHGTADRVVPVSMADELYTAAREPKELWLVEDLAHTAIFCDHADAAFPRVLDFLGGCLNHQR